MKNIKDFYDYLLVKRGFSDVTIDGYKKVLTRVLKDLGTLKPRRSQVENYIVEMRKKKYSFSHIRNTSVILEKYMEFIGRSVKFARMRRPKPIIKDTLTEGEIARILAACKNSREQAIIATLAYSGIRNKEFCGLKTTSVDLDGGVLKIVNGKGSKDRIAYISRECVKIVSEYLRDYPRNGQSFLITTLVRDNQYTGWDLRKRVKVLARRAGIRKRTFPHLFRHSLAVNLLARGGNIMTIQQILGHQSLQSTLIYAHSIPHKVQNEYHYFCPNYS